MVSCFPIFDFFCSYKEQRSVKIHSVTVGVIYWCLMILIAIFIAVFFLWYNQGYQATDSAESAITTKLHGLAYVDRSQIKEVQDRIWDNADFMIPPKENGAFTVITSFQVTPRQTQTTCDEDPSVHDARCSQHSDCEPNKLVINGNGRKTGTCMQSSNQPNTTVCEIRAWCPVEIDDESKRAPLATENFTVSIRNNVKFPKFGRTRQNVPDDMTDDEFQECVYDPQHVRYRHCPVFKIGTIVQEAGANFQDIVLSGAVIEIIIDWDCNFDVKEECLPSYRFYRLDRSDHNATRGFHMRYADHYRQSNGQHIRTLYRAFGIRVVVVVYGQGRQFDIYQTLKTIGSGLSYFGIATIVVSTVILGFFGDVCCSNKCCFRPMVEEKRTDTDKEGDTLTSISFAFKDAFRKKHYKACCECECHGEGDDPAPGSRTIYSRSRPPPVSGDPKEKKVTTDPKEIEVTVEPRRV